MRDLVREWLIVGSAICLVSGGLYLTSPGAVSSGSSSRSASSVGAPTSSASQPSGATEATSSSGSSDSSISAHTPSPSESPGTAATQTATAIAQAPAVAPQAPVAPRALSAPPTAPQTAANPVGGALTERAQVVGASTAAPAGTAPLAGKDAGDPGQGRQVFKKCQACHSTEPGKNLLGPSLAGVLGRKSGSEPDYNYSSAMKGADLVWNPVTLDAYLNDPQEKVPGNKMPFPGLKTSDDRRDVIAYLATTGGSDAQVAANTGAPTAPASPVAPAVPANTPGAPLPQAAPPGDIGYIPDANYTLRSGIAEGRMVYLGVGGAIDGKVNPVLTAAEGQVVQLTLVNGEGAEHDIVFPDQDAKSPRVTGKGASTTIAFRAAKTGDFIYFCSVPGHQLAGMQGQFVVTPKPAPQVTVEADISREPTDLPPPLSKRDPQTVHVDLLTAEVEGRLAEGTTFGYWTFNGKVPGPFLRVRVGDTIDIHLKNAADSAMIHSVDFHAATGPGGGAAVLQVDPGKEKSLTWKALVPGLYVYHCATPMVAEHIANGMYGLILVEPEGGLSPVDREFYVMQGEVYTDGPFGQHGSQEFSVEKLMNERPEYFVFNGSVGALSKLHPLRAKVGEMVRIFFGVGGPNFTSSFHVIGSIFDKVYTLGGVETDPLEGIQTVGVPPGGAVIAEFKTKVPGNYTLVDHAIVRTERGLVGILNVEGAPSPDIYGGVPMPGMGH